MASDIEVTKDASGELMIARAAGLTDEGTDFIDAYVPRSGKIHVSDSGLIFIHEDDVPNFISGAQEQGLQLVGTGV